MQTSGITSNVSSSRLFLCASLQPTSTKHPSYSRLLSVKAPNDIRPVDPSTEKSPAAEHNNPSGRSDITVPPGKRKRAPFEARRGKKFPPTRSTYFGMSAGWLLRHTAKGLGFEVTPDGFVRVSDVLSFDYFNHFGYTPQKFADEMYNDPKNRFEMVFMPDLIDGVFREVWWVRARSGHSMPDVDANTKRILNMGRLKAVVYLATVDEWDSIRKYGILVEKNRVVPVYKPGEGILPRRSVPSQKEYVCITIDAEKAAQLGVRFFRDNSNNVMAIGNSDEVIPVAAFRSAIQLEVTIEDLK
ncbi:hypothetical protein M413DRAFT_25250 [Hebeloma cylindrosporum]|uniref:2'-phosphotransferase n=1 Tax=Hebeloma cylindrosporum TaxID=76867 RepID=A0A0C2Y4N9_HEBCY|nr:hypothetical protein M413DRAFT_25250 [Hebeloma cylindrosporum h7]